MIICKACQYALVPVEIASHLRTKHQKDEGFTAAQITVIANHCLTYPARPPAWIKEMPVELDTTAIPFLRLYHSAFSCRRCPVTHPYTCLDERSMVVHLKERHQWSRPKGRQSGASQGASGLQIVAAFPVACQTFFRRNLYIRHLPVNPTPGTVNLEDQPGESRSCPPTPSISEQVKLQLSEKLAASNRAAPNLQDQQHFSQVPPWLETTRWTRYLHGQDLVQAARLIEIPSLVADQQEDQSEALLLLLLDSFDRVIEQARASLLEDKVNVFDQHRVDSFIPRRSYSRPLWHKLKESTYLSYKKVWKQFLCFLYRLVRQRQALMLHCRLTSTQSAALEATLRSHEPRSAARNLLYKTMSILHNIKR